LPLAPASDDVPLADPPPVEVARALPARRLAGTILHRVFRRDRPDPWWFATVPERPEHGGRFDLPAPFGACYWATSPVAAALEALADMPLGVVPDAELRARSRAVTTGPAGVRAVQLTAARAHAAGVAAALWAGDDRLLTQAWAARLHQARWEAAYHGTQHDPTGRLRAVTLFDLAGDHPPSDGRDWAVERYPLHDDVELRDGLARYGLHVTRSDVDLRVVGLDDSGLL
jgi:hypothetical protein